MKKDKEVKEMEEFEAEPTGQDEGPHQDIQKPAGQENELQNYVNNELRFAEETIIRTLRQVVGNISNAVASAQKAPQQK